MKDWKTTLTGLAAGILQLIVPVVQGYAIDGTEWALAAALTALGVAMPDKKPKKGDANEQSVQRNIQ